METLLLSPAKDRLTTEQIDLGLTAFRHMCRVKAMAATYEANRNIATYVHSTSRGHEAVQLATAFHLRPTDWVSPYYRDESLLLGVGWSPYELMLQLLTRRDDPFTGGRSYYSHPNSRHPDRPGMIHQSSATGMQAIPTTGIAQGIRYREEVLGEAGGRVVVCSLGDASVTEGEVAEAFQFAVLKKLPILYLVQDNDWGISVSAAEGRAMNAYEYAAGFKGMRRMQVNGTDFFESHERMGEAIESLRRGEGPILVHARTVLLNHHTSGVRKEFYRSDEDLALHAKEDPFESLKLRLSTTVSGDILQAIEAEEALFIASEWERAVAAPEPDPATVAQHLFAPTPVTEEKGVREPAGRQKIVTVDAALFAIRELMEAHPECLLYGQDVGRRLGGVFREAATLAERFGDARVFNTAIQEAYIVGSTAGMSAVGLKPIVEVQFADYIYPGLNQLVCEVAKSGYLTGGRFPVGCILRVPVGAYGGGGPYHSGSVETTLLSIKGIKIAYPSTVADMKGLIKAAYYDPNPVVMLEHKGLYWSKVPGTDGAKGPEPDADYILPFGKGRIVQAASEAALHAGDSAVVITYGMGVYWGLEAAKALSGRIEIVDLRTLSPLDEALVMERVRLHGRCLALTEEQQTHSFAEALAGRISHTCFRYLDAPVEVLGALDLPAVPLNKGLEAAMLPNADKVRQRLEALLEY